MDAQQTLNQISFNTRMAIAARDFVVDGEGNALRFRVTIKRGAKQVVEIKLTAADLYDVRRFRITKDWNVVTESEVSGVGCDQLDAVVFALGSGK